MKRLVFILLSISLLLVSSTYTAQASSKSTTIYTHMLVSASQLNVRSAPDVKAGKLKTVSKNTDLTAVALKDGWVKVQLAAGSFGWVSGDYVYTKDTEPSKKIIAYEEFLITTQSKLRAGAGEKFPLIATLEKDSVVHSIYSSGNWVLVSLDDGREGFVPQSSGKQMKMFLSSWEETAATPNFVKAGTTSPPISEDNNPSNPPNTQGTTTPSVEEIKVLNIDASSADAVIKKLEAVRKSQEFDLSITTSIPVSYSSRQDGSQITVTVRDAQGIDSGDFDLKAGGLDILQVAQNGRDTILTISASLDSTFTTQNMPGQNKFMIKIPMTTDPSIPDSPPGNLLLGKTIVLDAGHGGTQSSSSDPGATSSSGLKERDVVLDIANKTRDILQMQGATVLMTREGLTTALSLNGRALLANDNNADVFVAIHANSSTSPTLSGTSTYFYAPVDKPLGVQRDTRKALAQSVQQALVEKLQRRNIGVLEANFQVLRDTTVPSILVETAFLSNADEVNLLADELFRSKAAEGIAQGLINYLTR